jgi:hypothetical protein
VTDDIDRILDRSLSEGFDELRSTTPLPAPRYAPVAARRSTFRRRLRFGVPLVLGTNMLVGVSVVSIAAASVGAKAVVTGSPNPLVWNQPITQVSPSASPEGPGRGDRSPEPEPTSTPEGGESPGDQSNGGSGSDGTSPQPSSDASGDGGQTAGGGDGSATPTSGGDGGRDGGSSPTPSGGSDGGGSSHGG